MSSQVYVIGAGMTPFGKFADQRLRSLGREAAAHAIRDAGIAPHDIGLMACGNARSGTLQGQESGLGQMVGWEVGLEQIPVFNVKAYCASGAAALNVARLAVAAGEVDIALAVGLEKLSSRPGTGKPLTSDGMEVESDLGFSPPAYYAMAAQRHMETYGTTPQQLASVAVKNRAHAQHNSRAQYTAPITADDVLASPIVAGPLHLLDCCPTGDGAAAVVLASEDKVRALGLDRAVRIDASIFATGRYSDVQRDMSTFKLDIATATRAYETAGVDSADLDVVEVHDSFTISEIIHYEDLGLCSPGEGGRLVESGATTLGGLIPVNTSGGLLAKGHPLGATGLAQIVEITEQLRGEAGQRQVEDATVGLAHVSGGFMAGDFATSCVTIMSR